MGAPDTMLYFGHVAEQTSKPKFARHNGKTYEYGEVTMCPEDRKKDKYKVLGKAKTLNEAMQLNGMEPLCSGMC